MFLKGKKLKGTYNTPSGKMYNLNNDGTVINEILSLQESKEFCDGLKDKCAGFIFIMPVKENYDKIDWDKLSANPSAIELLEEEYNKNHNTTKINWDALSANPGIFIVK